MAPDKIYLAFKDGFVAQSANHKDAILKKYVPLTYIRKDALVERINEQILFYQNSVPVNDYEEGCNKGAIAALEHIVESL